MFADRTTRTRPQPRTPGPPPSAQPRHIYIQHKLPPNGLPKVISESRQSTVTVDSRQSTVVSAQKSEYNNG